MSTIVWTEPSYELVVDKHWKAEVTVTFVGPRPKAVLCVERFPNTNSPDKVVGSLMSRFPAAEYIQPTTHVPVSQTIPAPGPPPVYATSFYTLVLPVSCAVTRYFRITPMFIGGANPVTSPNINGYPDRFTPQPAPPGAGAAPQTIVAFFPFPTNPAGSDVVHIAIMIRDPQTGGGERDAKEGQEVSNVEAEIKRIDDALISLKRSTTRRFAELRKLIPPAKSPAKKKPR